MRRRKRRGDIRADTKGRDKVDETDDLQSTYAPYRAALFRTNGKSQSDAQQAITQAQQAWKGIAERFAAKALAVYDKAAGEINTGKLPEAHETLEAVRDLMAGLRQRNGVAKSPSIRRFHAHPCHQFLCTRGLGGLRRFWLWAQCGPHDRVAGD